MVAEFENLINEFRSLATELEWIEFKENFTEESDTGEYISALANSAALHRKPKAYLVWGIHDKTHEVVGTTFCPRLQKAGSKHANSNQELESWLLMHLSPRIEIRFFEGLVDSKHIVVLEVQPAFSHPVRFKNIAYIRVGTYNKKLSEFPEKERRLWDILGNQSFEKVCHQTRFSAEEVLVNLDYGAYFKLVNEPIPTNQTAILSKLCADQIIEQMGSSYAVTNLGAILLATELNQFGRLGRNFAPHQV